jgi:carbon monoxide dehydrogenase subunit G
MTTATRCDHLDMAPQVVFDRIVDPTSVPPGMTIKRVNEDTDGVGNVYEWTYRLLGIPVRGVTVYTEYEPSRRFACRNLGFVAATVVFTVEPEEGGTRLTREMDFEVHVPLLGKLLEALMVKAAQPDAARTVACPKLVDFFLREGTERRSG